MGENIKELINALPLEFTTNAKYKEVVSVTFTPVTEVNITKKYKKGDWRFWKLFGFIPVFRYEVKEDLYESPKWSGLKTLKKAEKYYPHQFVSDGKLFKEGYIIISYTNGSNDYEYFSSDKKGMELLDEVKENCKKVGNELK